MNIVANTNRTKLLSDFYILNYFINIKRYEEKIERVESRMTNRLRDQLGTAKVRKICFRICFE